MNSFYTEKINLDGLCSNSPIGCGWAKVTGFGRGPVAAIRSAIRQVEAKLGQSVLPQRMELVITDPYGKVVMSRKYDHNCPKDAFYPLTNRDGFLMRANDVPHYSPISLREEIRQQLLRGLRVGLG